MTAQIFRLPTRRQRPSDAQREAAIYLEGRTAVTSAELADHFARRGWAMGQIRASHLLAEMGWTARRIEGGTKSFARPSPIADGSWRRPWLEPAEPAVPDRLPSLRRRRRWNLAFAGLMGAGALYFLAQFIRAAFNHGSLF